MIHEGRMAGELKVKAQSGPTNSPHEFMAQASSNRKYLGQKNVAAFDSVVRNIQRHADFTTLSLIVQSTALRYDTYKLSITIFRGANYENSYWPDHGLVSFLRLRSCARHGGTSPHSAVVIC